MSYPLPGLPPYWRLRVVNVTVPCLLSESVRADDRFAAWYEWMNVRVCTGIGCPVKFYIRCPGNRKIGIFGFPKIRNFGNPGVRKSENLDLWIPGNPDFRKPEFRKTGHPENPDFRVFRFSGFSKIGKSKNPIKMHRM